MSHETHNDGTSEIAKSTVSFKSSFWLAVIIVGLFIASLNFIQVMGKGEGEGEKKEATEATMGEKPAAEGEKAKEEAKPAAEAPKAEAAKPAEAPKAEAPAAAKDATKK